MIPEAQLSIRNDGIDVPAPSAHLRALRRQPAALSSHALAEATRPERLRKWIPASRGRRDWWHRAWVKMVRKLSKRSGVKGGVTHRRRAWSDTLISVEQYPPASTAIPTAPHTSLTQNRPSAIIHRPLWLLGMTSRNSVSPMVVPASPMPSNVRIASSTCRGRGQDLMAI